MPVSADDRRRRGRIEVRGTNLRVIVYAGLDPVTGRRAYLRETVQGTTKASYKRADTVMARLAAKVDAQRVTESAVTLRSTLAEWMSVTELEDTTRDTYQGYIDRTINPALGDLPIKKLTARTLETFNAELRRCRQRCDGRPRIDHRAAGLHDCDKAQCKPHVCKPFAVSTVRQIHAVISGALTAAVRWEWIASNPARTAKRPRQQAPQPTPPSADEAARLLQAAFDISMPWGVLVWLAMTTGMRRGELAALRWENLDLDAGVIEIRSNYVSKAGIEKLKDTKTHQMRRIALDGETVVLLLRLRELCFAHCKSLNIEFTPKLFVFVNLRDPNPQVPVKPDSISGRYKYMATRIGIDTHLHALRHYSATELLTAGVDLRTVAGRLGHGGGGATTLRVYAAWVAASDRKAAELLRSRLPRPKHDS